MKNIIFRTLERSLSKIVIIGALIVGVLVGAIMYSSCGTVTIQCFDGFINDLITKQNLFILFIITSTTLAHVATTGSNIIATEYAEGTLRLLVAKPNSRESIMLGKLIGTYAGSFIYYCLALFSYYSYIIIATEYDGIILREMFNYLPAYLIFGLIIIFVFLAISTLFSTIMKKKALALIPVLFIVAVIFAYFPMQRIINDITGSTNSFFGSLLDMNYHISLIFKQCLEICGGIGKNVGVVVFYLTKLFVTQLADIDIEGMTTVELVVNNTLSSLGVTITYIIISIGLYIASFAIFKHKDI